jgi:hypothetical protein
MLGLQYHTLTPRERAAFEHTHSKHTQPQHNSSSSSSSSSSLLSEDYCVIRVVKDEDTSTTLPLSLHECLRADILRGDRNDRRLDASNTHWNALFHHLLAAYTHLQQRQYAHTPSSSSSSAKSKRSGGFFGFNFWSSNEQTQSTTAPPPPSAATEHASTHTTNGTATSGVHTLPTKDIALSKEQFATVLGSAMRAMTRYPSVTWALDLHALLTNTYTHTVPSRQKTTGASASTHTKSVNIQNNSANIGGHFTDVHSNKVIPTGFYQSLMIMCLNRKDIYGTVQYSGQQCIPVSFN